MTLEEVRVIISDYYQAEINQVSWVFGPTETDPNQRLYLVALNAFSVLLGLPLNLHDFEPRTDFVQDARRLVHAVLGGHADWRLIWSFLRCHNLVASSKAPEVGRRFSHTIPINQMQEHQERMMARKLPNMYEHFYETARL
jgi:hypothetical protein